MLDPEKNIHIYAGRHIPLDENGHLVNAGDWSEELALHLAEVDGLDQDDRHWLVIRFSRGYHGHFDCMPMTKVLIKGLNKEAAEERYTMKFLCGLFPDHHVRRSCRYAGVPQPAGRTRYCS